MSALSAVRPSLLIAGGTVFTVDSEDRVLEPGWVRLRDGAINCVTAEPLTPEPGEEVIDAKGKAVLPGFVNTHTHLFQTFLRGVYEERPLATYLAYIYRCGLLLNLGDSRVSALLGSIEQIRSGVTTVVDHHFLNRGEELAAATIDGMQETGVRAVLARTVMDVGDALPPAILETPEAGLRSVERLLEMHAPELEDGMLSIWTGPNTPGVNASIEVVIATRDFAEQHGIRRSAHVAEYKGVVESVKRRYGYDGVVAWLDDAGALGPDLLAVHAVQVDPHEVPRLAASGASISHNPFSNLFCGDRMAPVSDYLREGVAVGLGTDGAANNSAQTVLDALRITRMLQRLHPMEPHAIGANDAIRMATLGGAQALGMDAITGSLEPGKRADVIVVDVDTNPHLVPLHDVIAQVVHSVKASDVRTVICDGRVLMRDRRIVVADEEAILAQAQQQAVALVERLG